MAFLLDVATRDLLFNNNKHFQICNKEEDIRQRILLKLELNKGEWFLNDTGVPWAYGLDGIMDQSGEECINLAKLEISKVLREDEAVLEVRELNVSITSQSLIINFTVYCTDENEYTITITKEV